MISARFLIPALCALGLWLPAHAATPDSLIARSHSAESGGNLDAAIRLAQAAIVANPADPGVYQALGDLYARHGEPEAARFYYGEALNLDPMDDAAKQGMARTEMAARDAAAARSLDKP